jgi:hypothetical protein
MVGGVTNRFDIRAWEALWERSGVFTSSTMLEGVGLVKAHTSTVAIGLFLF